ncbi:hypothetical protein Dimus_034310 [Dionaea muscipula]
MNCIQAASSLPLVKVKAACPVFVHPSMPHLRGTHAHQLSIAYAKLSVPKHQWWKHMCHAKSKDKAEDGDEQVIKSLSQGSGWKPLRNLGFSMGNQSVEDRLRKQIEEEGLFDDGDGDGGDDGGRGRSGPGGGGGGGEPGGPEAEGFLAELDDLFQGFMAIVGLVLVYIYVLEESGPFKTVRDYFIFRLGGRKSVRLRLAMYSWEELSEKWFAKKKKIEVEDEDPRKMLAGIRAVRTGWEQFGTSRILQPRFGTRRRRRILQPRFGTRRRRRILQPR